MSAARWRTRFEPGALGSLFLVMLVLHPAPAEAATPRAHTFSDKDFEFTLEVNQKPSADGASPFCELKSVTVRRKPDGQELQKLALEGILLECGVEPGALLIVEDIDFDGRKDLRVLRLLDARLQSTFDYWVYDKKTGRFEKDARFEALSTTRRQATGDAVRSCPGLGDAVFLDADVQSSHALDLSRDAAPLTQRVGFSVESERSTRAEPGP